MPDGCGVSVDDRSEYQGDGLGLVDDKGRVAIPASLRQALATNSPRPGPKTGVTVLVSVHPQRQCLLPYDPAYFKILEAEIEAIQARHLDEFGEPDY